MIVDGLKFSKCHTVIALPNTDKDGNRMPYVKEGQENYVHFGQIVKVPAGETPSSNLIDTGTTYTDGSPVYAKVIPFTGHSLTNMMYASGAYKGYAYLMQDGKYYRAKVNKASATDVAEVVAESSDEVQPVQDGQTDQDAQKEESGETVDLSSLAS